MSNNSPRWSQLRKIRRGLQARMPHDKFINTVLEGCFQVARDRDNPIRGNFVASGLREASGHVLHSLAPDDAVRACVWFVQAKDTKTVTRQQRATYIVKAGLPDDFVSGTLGIDVRDYTDPLIKVMDGLNKSTHVRAETVLYKGSKIRVMIRDVLLGLDQLLEASTENRDAITHAVSDVMQETVFEKLISETIGELDELSTHTTVSGHNIDTVSVVELDAHGISYRVEGEVEVELQYGSNSDVRNDIGFQQDDSYPYVVTVTCSVARPMAIRADDLNISVDTKSFYE